MAIFASCGLLGSVHGPVQGPGGAVPSNALIQTADLLGRVATTTLHRGEARLPSCKSEARTGQELPERDGDGPGHDSLWRTEAFDPSSWLCPGAAPGRVLTPGVEGILKGLVPDAGGKRGPPVVRM